jgi:1-deoxy-D-xylulose-5-phosphate reductoisomerase
MSSPVKTINILGATGSVGRCAADVIMAAPGRFDVTCVSAYDNAAELAELAVKLGAKKAVLANPAYFPVLKESLGGTGIEALCGEEALAEITCMNVDVTLAAIVGIAGLRPVMNAVQHSRAVALANKEPLVAAGAQVMALAAQQGTKILPVDSEHNAIFQVFDPARRSDIEKIILTASGGPFRAWSVEDMRRATPAQALAHPNWTMGRKISIDSATMMNKALEVIEAHYLFDMPPEKIDVLIHPQSVVHSLVEYCDGSVLAQMGASDMRTPLANVLAWPERLPTPGERLDLRKMTALNFEEPDPRKFPALRMAYDCLRAGPAACITLNAANEIAVDAFLRGRIGFLDIVCCVDHILQTMKPRLLAGMDDIYDFDESVRTATLEYLNKNFAMKVA